MGWGGYGLYDGDGTQTCHYDFLIKSGAAKNDDEIYDNDWLQYKRTVIPKDRINIFKNGMNKILKKKKTPMWWDEDKAIESQMLLSLYIDNKIKPPKIVKKLGIEATKYLMGNHASDFDNPSARRAVLRRFIEKVNK